ncbi:MAG: hypothetical protein K8F25_16300, partial [Fimbriimonadaceae bacterium]|nr:hypothetical protein [Alphaproteobacteria bacterium]
MILWIGLIILGGALVLLLFNHDSGAIAGMDNYDFAAIAQYSALAVLISAGIVAAYRGRLKTGLKHALIWALVALGLVIVYAFRRDFLQAGNQVIAVLVPGYPAENSLADGSHEITLRQRSDGHFVANVRIKDITI